MMNDTKKLGVLGGMGPKATSVFFDKLIARTDAEEDQAHIDAVIVNHASLPDRTRVIANGKKALFLAAIAEDIKLLEQANVSHIAIPCNTSHYFYDELQAMTTVPIINMVEETVKELAAADGWAEHGDHSGHAGNIQKIALLATDGTVSSGIYNTWCQRYGLTLHTPAPPLQREVMDIIYQVKAGHLEQEERLAALMTHFIEQEQCDKVILACTELSCLALSDDLAAHYVDAMEVLIKEAIVRSGKGYRY